MKELATKATKFVLQGLWLLAISPVVIPAALISFLVSRGEMDVGGGMAFGITFAVSAAAITALYIGVGIGYLV